MQTIRPLPYKVTLTKHERTNRWTSFVITPAGGYLFPQEKHITKRGAVRAANRRIENFKAGIKTKPQDKKETFEVY